MCLFICYHQDKKAKKEKRSKQEEIAGYTNKENPWGDQNLTDKFVWKLKRDKEKLQGFDPDQLDKEREEQRRIELLVSVIINLLNNHIYLILLRMKWKKLKNEGKREK